MITFPSLRFAALALMAFFRSGLASDYALVSNTQTGVTNVTSVELIQVLKGETATWNNGRKILLVMPKEGSKEEAVLLDKIYKTDSDGLRKYWIAQVYQNHLATAPKSASTNAALKLVEIKPEAVAVVNVAEIPASERLKVVSIDGKKPGESGYLLSGN